MVFNTALSGINAASKNLDVIGNNIANSNTIGFKSSRALFEDVYATSYGGSGNMIGSGVRLSSVGQNFSEGQTNFTNNSLDLMIRGNGFFVLSNQGAKVYTRAGAFQEGPTNYIENASGQRLVGYLADANGNLTPNAGEININKANIPAHATTSFNAGFNLQQTPDSIPSANWVGGATPSNDTFNYKSASTIYDSFGNAHTLSMFFIKADSSAAAGAPNASTPAGTANQWYVALQIDNQNVPANVGTDNTQNLYRINFNGDGTFAGAADTSNNPLPNNQLPLSFNLGNGSNPLSINVDLSNTTQTSDAFGMQNPIQDGYSTGRYMGLSIDGNGVITGGYSNGQTKTIAQLQLADFANVNGLTPLSGNNWMETSASGQALLGQPGSSSLGMVQAGALESSNVDLTAELINLIGAQRDFQANAQTIRTGDAVTQTIINIR